MAWWIVGVLACAGGGGGDGGTDDTDGDAPTMTVAPNYGLADGGQEITLAGGPFEGDVAVWFGGVEAEIVSVAEDAVVVRTPSWGNSAMVDVELHADNGDAYADDAFTFWENGGGKYGALGVIEWFDTVGYYGADTPDWGDAWVAFTVPTGTSVSRLLFGKDPDTCERDYEFVGQIESYVPGSDALTLNGAGGSSLSLGWAGDEGRFETALTEGQYVADTWTVAAIEQPGWATFEMTLAETPPPFAVTSPDLAAVTPAPTGSEIALAWDGDPGDYVLAALYRYEGDVPVDRVTCVLADDGAFTVPSDVWTSWTAGQAVTIAIGRAIERGETVPYNQSASGVVGIAWTVGVVQAQ